MSDSWKTFTPDTQCLKGKVIAITGAGAGIGRTLAKSMASYGATIILIGRTVEKLESIYDEIENTGSPQPAIIPIDFEQATDTDYKNIQESIETTFGQLDGLIHNAAELGDRTSIASYPLSTWERIMKINVNGPFALTKYCLPLLQKSPSASVVFTSSSVGIKGRAYWGAYAVSKGALENLTETLADELHETSDIRVNSINPGATRTDMRAKAYPAEDPSRVKSPEELSTLYIYMMSDVSIGISGQQITY